MTDTLNDQISAFIDDELMSEESELLVRRLCNDDTLRQTAARYTLMGNAIRGSLHEIRADLNGNIMRAIEAEELPDVAPAALAPRANWVRLAGGGAMAAAVAVFAVLAIRPAQGPTVDPAFTFASNDSSEVVPADREEVGPFRQYQNPVAPLVQQASNQSQLERFLLRHNQYSKTTMRQGVLVYRTMATEVAPAAGDPDGGDDDTVRDGDITER